MQQLTTTPFGRRQVTSGLIASAARAAVPAADDAVDKWQVFRDLTTARAALGLPSRALTVLSALLSFHPETELCGDDPIIVFPSNRRLAERAHGMAEATLRRHLAALTEAGLILRHDSPNGKRYAARDGSGALSAVFGFDLRPLLVRAAEIAAAARATRDAAEALRRKRECLVLLIRDCDKLAAFIGPRDDPAGAASHTTPLAGLRAALRRKLDAAALDQLCNCAATIRSALETQAAALCQTVQSSGQDAQTER
ncbi:MAG: replication initiation protein, partial [Mangrovicoccus sp.]|nr:replication initiation protein [Mangrovicoccus sp.]